MRTDTFKLDLGEMPFGDDSSIAAIISADIESDEEGTFFQLYALRWENIRIEKSDWRWAAVAEWIAFDVARKPFGLVRSAHAEAPEFQRVAA